MSDVMKTESLPPGQNSAGPAEGGVSQPGATPAENATPQSAEERNAGGRAGLTGSAAWLRGLEAEKVDGGVASLEAEMGGGGGVDPVEDYFKRVGLDNIQGFIAEQQGKNYPDTSSIKLPDGTSISFGEYKKIAIAIQEAQAGGDRRAVEEIIREARRPAAAASPPPPEPQPTPRPTDWRDTLQKDQKERLKRFEMNISKLDFAQLQGLLSRIKQLQALAPADGWQGKGILEEDVAVCLRVIMERIEETGGQREIIGDIRNITRVARITGWRPPPEEFDPKIDLSTGSTNGT